jgi:hypothetical protein
VLAIASAKGGLDACPGSSGVHGWFYVVSGPIAKEIGMNAGIGALMYGSPANMTLGRVGSLMTVNFGNCITGVSMSLRGGTINSLAFAEDDDGLPPGWETLREEAGYKKTESSIGKTDVENVIEDFGNKPSSLRSFVAEGTGGMGRAVGVEGQKGPHNALAYFAPLMWNPAFTGVTMVMHPNIALSLYDYGFKTKASAYKWLWDKYLVTKADFYNTGDWDNLTNAGVNIEPTSGKKWNDLPMDFTIHRFGSSADENCIIVGVGSADEEISLFSGGTTIRPIQYPIDPWK